MSRAFVRNLIEKALYECMHIQPTDDPMADHRRRIDIWEEAFCCVAQRCSEVAEDYAAKKGLMCDEDQAICDGIRDALLNVIKTAKTSG